MLISFHLDIVPGSHCSFREDTDTPPTQQELSRAPADIADAAEGIEAASVPTESPLPIPTVRALASPEEQPASPRAGTPPSTPSASLQSVLRAGKPAGRERDASPSMSTVRPPATPVGAADSATGTVSSSSSPASSASDSLLFAIRLLLEDALSLSAHEPLPPVVRIYPRACARHCSRAAQDPSLPLFLPPGVDDRCGGVCTR